MDAWTEPTPPWVRKLYQFLTLAYPRAYRQTYGPLMVQLFCDQYRAAQATPQAGAQAAFWLHVLIDLTGSALREQAEHLWRRMMGARTDSAGTNNPRGILVKVLLGLAFFLIAAFFWTLIGPQWGSGVLIGLAFLIVVAFLFSPRLQKALGRVSAGVWLAAAGVTLILLLAWPAWMIEPGVILPESFPQVIRLVLMLFPWVIPGFSLTLSALLLYVGWKRVQDLRNQDGQDGNIPHERRKTFAREAIACFSLGALILVKILHGIYWLAVWDSTYDSLDHFWLIPSVLSALFTGTLLVYVWPGKMKWAGAAYALLLPAALIVLFGLGKQVEYRGLTEHRAERIAQALEAYHARNGAYPTALGQLTPTYLLALPGPMIISGQTWCYQGGAESYTLGAVDREHWSSPELFGRLYAAQGETGDSASVCAAEIAAMRARNPRYYGIH